MTTKTLRDYQQKAVDLALESLAPGSRLLLVSPTGTGKSFMELTLKASVPDSVILSPSEEILRHYASDLGVPLKDREAHGLYTATAFRNRLMDGMDLPSLIIVDEAHGYTDTTSVVTSDILAICPDTPAVGFTATAFRGTPTGTEALKGLWGSPQVVLSLTEAVRRGYWQMPSLSIKPLLDDDQLTVVNGEFQISAVNDGTQSRMESLIKIIRDEREGPTVVNLPSTEVVRTVEMIMGDEVCSITQSSTRPERDAAYAACESGEKILLQIRAISVGVDMPWLQTMIDARPTMSPVLFLQTFGRLTRPYPCAKKYVVLNRNLERHAYLLDGLAPMSVIGESQEAFGGFSERATAKTIGLEAAGKFKIIPVPLANGVTAGMYALQTLNGKREQLEYLLLCLPNFQKPIVFSRKNGKAKWKPNGLSERAWGKWSVSDQLPTDFVGYRTNSSTRELSDKQKAFWERSAGHRGLDPEVANDISRREFAILPALLDSRLSLKELL